MLVKDAPSNWQPIWSMQDVGSPPSESSSVSSEPRKGIKSCHILEGELDGFFLEQTHAQVKTSILDWFQTMGVRQGNPEDLVAQHQPPSKYKPLLKALNQGPVTGGLAARMKAKLTIRL